MLAWVEKREKEHTTTGALFVQDTVTALSTLNYITWLQSILHTTIYTRNIKLPSEEYFFFIFFGISRETNKKQSIIGKKIPPQT